MKHINKMKALLTLFFVLGWVVFCLAQTWIHYGIPANLSGSITSLVIDGQNNKWCVGEYYGTGGFSVLKYDGSSWVVYDSSNSGLCSNIVKEVEADGNVVWFATDKGVSKFDGVSWTCYDTSNSGLGDNKVNCMAIDDQHVKWFGTENGKLISFDDNTCVSIPKIQTVYN